MVQTVHGEHVSGVNIGMVPWWHRVFYLHVAGTVLIAAMLQPDLYTSSVSQSWNTAMMVLRAHAHLSASIQQCVLTFQALSSKILEAQRPVSGKAAPPDGGVSTNAYFQDIFQDLVFDNSLFGAEDLAWLGNEVL